jgi:hypothetical protein
MVASEIKQEDEHVVHFKPPEEEETPETDESIFTFIQRHAEAMHPSPPPVAESKEVDTMRDQINALLADDAGADDAVESSEDEGDAEEAIDDDEVDAEEAIDELPSA